jgi:magnesium transporter
MDTVVDRYFPILDALETKARADRGADLPAQHRGLRHRSPLRLEREPDDPEARRRSAHRSVSKLYRGRVPQICSGMGVFRDVFDHLQRLHATIEAIRDMQTAAVMVVIDSWLYAQFKKIKWR